MAEKKLKIMHIGQMIGGLDVYIRNSIIYATSNFEYIIVHGKEDESKPVVKEGVAIKEYAVSLYRSLNPIKDIRGLCQCVKLIKKEKPDLIHCHSAKGGIIGRIAGAMTKTKTFYTPHAFSYLCTESKFKRRLFLTIERLTKFKTNLLACSDSERELGINVVKYKEDRAFVWNNAVPDPKKNP